jgi:hypothetical protein
MTFTYALTELGPYYWIGAPLGFMCAIYAMLHSRENDTDPGVGFLAGAAVFTILWPIPVALFILDRRAQRRKKRT